MAEIIAFPGPMTRPTSLQKTTVRFFTPRPGARRVKPAQLPLPLPSLTGLEARIHGAKATSAWYQEQCERAGTPPERERLAKRLREWNERTDALIAEKAAARVQGELLPPPAAP